MRLSETCLKFGYQLETSECASWVQAWGSIGAILATAIGLGLTHWFARRRSNQASDAAETRFLEGLFQLVGGARGIATKISELEGQNPGTPHDRMRMHAELEAVRSALVRVDLSRLYRYEILASALVAESNVRMMISAIQWVTGPHFSVQLERGYLASVASQAVQSIDPHAARLRDLIEKRGGIPKVEGSIGIPPHKPKL